MISAFRAQAGHLSGDIRLSFRESLIYYAYAFSESARGLFDSTPSARPIGNPSPAWAAYTGPVISPFRFWTEWRMPILLEKHFPARPFRVLDLGCGDGRYLRFFRTAKAPCAYVGLDLKPRPEWPEKKASYPLVSVNFIADNAEEPSRLEGPFDLWMTSSALEHFSDDGKAIDNISKYLAPGAIGVHAVPPHHGWAIYLKHGFRRYWPGRMVSLFTLRGHKVLSCEGLGGIAEFLCHFTFITIPERGLRRARISHPAVVALYKTLVGWAIRFDRYLPSWFCVGYVIVVQYGDRGGANE